MTNAILSVTREPPFKYAHVSIWKLKYGYNAHVSAMPPQHTHTHTLPHKLISKFTFTCMQMQRNEWKKKENCIYNLILSFLHSLRAEIFFATFYNETDFSFVCVCTVYPWRSVWRALKLQTCLGNVPSHSLRKSTEMVLWCVFFILSSSYLTAKCKGH